MLIKSYAGRCCNYGPLTINVPVIWILGGPGSGKGTQCERIVEKYGFTHLSSGDLLRAEVASGSSIGREVNEIMERGELVPTDVVLDLLKNVITNVEAPKGFLIDGYPRERQQGVQFETKVCPATIILFLDASEDVLKERLLSRGITSGRIDDNEETIKLRLETFNTHKIQIVEFYTDKLKMINAERTTDEIFAEIETYLDPLVVEDVEESITLSNDSNNSSNS